MRVQLDLKFSLTTLMIVLALGLCACSTFQNSQSEQGKQKSDLRLADRRLAEANISNPTERPEVLIKRVVSNGAFGIVGECRILKDGWVEILQGEHKVKKKIDSTLKDGQRPDSRAGNAQNKRRERSDWQLGQQYSEVELEGLIRKSMGGDLRILNKSDEEREENYSEIEISSWGQMTNGVRGAQLILRQDKNGSQSVNDLLSSGEIDFIASLTKSICH